MNETEWLKANRCPHCVNEGKPCGYKTRKAREGWHCHGYRSKHWDERMTFGKGAA